MRPFGTLLCSILTLVSLAARADEAPRFPGRTAQGFLLPNGWTVTPAGDQVIVTDLPLNIVPLADNRHALVATSGYNAHELSHEGLATRIADLAERARARRLSPDEVSGGTFTITNPGRYGALLATPIINQPQVAILDLEAVVRRPVVVGGDSIAIRPMTYLCMSWDHRVLDGALAAQFLSSVRRNLEEWNG